MLSGIMAQRDVLAEFTDLVCKQNVAVPVAAMHALVMTIADSEAQTWMELKMELDTTIARLQRCGHHNLGGRTNLSLKSGCALFMQHVMRAFDVMMESKDFPACRAELARRGNNFTGYSRASRANIAEIGHSFVQDNSTVLVHGNSRVVSELLLKAAESKKFRIIMTESRPNDVHIDSEPETETESVRKMGRCGGRFSNGGGGEDGGEDTAVFASSQSALQFAQAGIPTTVVLDCSVGAIMDQVDLCLVGAEGVMESGGIVNKVGTYTIAMVAKTLKKPFYVAVESYKFARLYPLRQSDITDNFRNDADDGGASSTAAIEAKMPKHENIKFLHTSVDYTPAEYITLLFTDLGVLTPAAVSDELIKLYHQ